MIDKPFPAASRRALIERQIEMWRSAFEDQRISGIVATALKDGDMQKRVAADMARSVQAIECLEALLVDIK